MPIQNEQSLPAVAKRPILPSAGAGAEQLSRIKDIAAETWMSPVKVLVAGIVISVIVSLIIYYTTSSLLKVAPTGAVLGPTNGIFTDSNWLTAGGGLLYMLLLGISLTCAGASIGMTWKNNGMSIVMSVGVSAIIGILHYFAFASVKDNSSAQFTFWAIASTIVSLVAIIYGWWWIRGQKNSQQIGADKDAVASRYKWITATAAVGAISTIVTAAGFWKINGTFKNRV